MKKSIAITLIIVAGIVGGGIGLGYEGTFYMFAPDYRYSSDGGTTANPASIGHISLHFFGAFLMGWAPCLLCLPLISLGARAAAKKKKSVALVSLTLGSVGVAYGAFIAFALYALLGGWGPSGLYGLVLSGAFMGTLAPILFSRCEEPNQPLQRNASTGPVSSLESPARRG